MPWDTQNWTDLITSALTEMLNLVLTFSISGISVGGHIGGLIGGAVAALLVLFVERRMSGRPAYTLEIVGIVLIVRKLSGGRVELVYAISGADPQHSQRILPDV